MQPFTSFAEALLKRARHIGKCIVRIASNKANCADHDYQNHGEHHRIFCYVLPTVVGQESREGAHFDVAPYTCGRAPDLLLLQAARLMRKLLQSGRKKRKVLGENIMLSAGHKSRLVFRFPSLPFSAYPESTRVTSQAAEARLLSNMLRIFVPNSCIRNGF